MLFHRKLCLIQIFFSSTWATSIFHFKWVLPFPIKFTRLRYSPEQRLVVLCLVYIHSFFPEDRKQVSVNKPGIVLLLCGFEGGWLCRRTKAQDELVTRQEWNFIFCLVIFWLNAPMQNLSPPSRNSRTSPSHSSLPLQAKCQVVF